MQPLKTFTMAFLDSFSFADLFRPARIPGSPDRLFAPESAEKSDRKDADYLAARVSLQRASHAKASHAERS
jgi:hypothetical protein